MNRRRALEEHSIAGHRVIDSWSGEGVTADPGQQSDDRDHAHDVAGGGAQQPIGDDVEHALAVAAPAAWVLDVIADRLALPTDAVFTAGEPDRMAAATMAVLRRNLVPLRVVEPWVARIAGTALQRTPPDADPHLSRGNAQAFLRALYLQLSLAPAPPEVRSDLLLVLVDLRQTNHLIAEQTVPPIIHSLALMQQGGLCSLGSRQHTSTGGDLFGTPASRAP